jgi:hypothetical protein
MNEEQRLQLNELMKANNTDDNTNLIRKLKHSKKIKRDVEMIENIKVDHPNADIKELDNLCIKECSFLFTNYTIIYNKLIRSQIDIHMLYVFIDKLKDIENGKLTQQEAAFDIGTILKQMYVDPRLKEMDEKKEVEYLCGKNISWLDFSKM